MTPRTQQDYERARDALKKVCESVRPSRPKASVGKWGRNVAMGGWFYGTWRA